MLSKSKATRYRTCADAASDLRSFLDGYDVAVEAPAGPVPYRELPFGTVALREKLISQDALLKCVRIQEECRAAGRPVPLIGEVMVREGLIAPDNIAVVLGLQSGGRARCPACRKTLNEAAAAQCRYRCPTCRSVMRVLPRVTLERLADRVEIEVSGACLHQDFNEILSPVIASVLDDSRPEVVLDLTGLKSIEDALARYLLAWALEIEDHGKSFRLEVNDTARARFERLGLGEHVRMEHAER